LAGDDGSTIRQPPVHLQITFLGTRSAENEAVDAAGTDRLKFSHTTHTLYLSAAVDSCAVFVSSNAPVFVNAYTMFVRSTAPAFVSSNGPAYSGTRKRRKSSFSRDAESYFPRASDAGLMQAFWVPLQSYWI
jgi:hypothetical protein